MSGQKKSAPGGTQISMHDHCTTRGVPNQGRLNMKQTKRHYYIFLDGEYVGQTWAVSEKKAVTNYWWKFVKESDPFTVREYNPSDFEAVAH